VLTGAVAGHAQPRWTNYLDTSIIREIVHRDGDLYMATSGGLVVYHISSGTFESFGNVDGLPSNDLTCLVMDASGTMYVGTSNIGIAKVVRSGSGISVLRTINQQIDGLANNSVTSVAAWSGDIVYGSTGGAGLITNDFPSSLFRSSEGLPSNAVADVLPIGDEAWIATDAGVAVVDRFDIVRRPSGGPANARVVGSDGVLVWVGTSDGVWTLDPSDSTWTNVGPVGEAIHSFHFDGQTMRAGGRRYFWEYLGGSNWLSRDVAPVYVKYALSVVVSEMRALVALGPDDIYLGAGRENVRQGINLVHWDGSTFTDAVPNAPGGNDIRRLSVDLDGSVWASFNSFWVGKLTPRGEWFNYNHTIPASDSLSNQFTNLTCLADLDGYKWFCTLTFDAAQPLPLDRLDDKIDEDYGNDDWEHYNIGSGGGDGLGSLRLQNALVDPTGNRWFLSDAVAGFPGWEGMHILSRDQSEWLQVKTDNSSLASGNVRDVAFTGSVAYLAVSTVGIQRWIHQGYGWGNLKNLADDSWPVLWAVPNAGESVSSLEYRSDGTIWAGTNEGVYRFLPGSSSPRHFGAFNGFGTGLLGIDVWDILLDHDENLWVATPQGLNRISREDENKIDAYSTPALYAAELSQRLFPFEVISPLVDARCQILALHPDDDILYIGTRSGMSVFDFSPPAAQETELSLVYVYPNPLYGRLGHNALKIANITSPVSVDVYTIEGELVHSQSALVSGDEIWDLTTAGGFIAASGVYVVRISTGAGEVVRTISVMR
jgi:hypothetical protein